MAWNSYYCIWKWKLDNQQLIIIKIYGILNSWNFWNFAQKFEIKRISEKWNMGPHHLSILVSRWFLLVTYPWNHIWEVDQRVSWCIMHWVFSPLQFFKHVTFLNSMPLAGYRTWCPTADLQHLCCKALINK